MLRTTAGEKYKVRQDVWTMIEEGWTHPICVVLLLWRQEFSNVTNQTNLSCVKSGQLTNL